MLMEVDDRKPGHGWTARLLLAGDSALAGSVGFWSRGVVGRMKDCSAALGAQLDPLLLLAGPHPPVSPTSPPMVGLVESTGTRTRRARLQREGIGANGTFSPCPATVNRCAHATSPSIVVLIPPLWWNVGWCCKLVWTPWPLSSHMVIVPATTGRCRFLDRAEQLGMVGALRVAGEPLPFGAWPAE